jgi:hypothetical protein
LKELGTRLVWPFVVFGYLFLISIPSAHAYIDPGSGSYLFQVLIGGLLAGAVAVKLSWKRAWTLLTRRSSSRKSRPTANTVKED